MKAPKLDALGGSAPKLHVVATRTHLVATLVLATAVALIVVLPALRSPAPFGVGRTGDGVYILDFASHFNFARDFWAGERPQDVSAYSVANHLRITDEWAGAPMERALPFGYSPTMLLLLAPLVLFSHAAALAILNAMGVMAAWWQTRPKRFRAGYGLLAFFTPLGMACFLLGQTAILTGAGLLYLFERSRSCSGRMVSRETILAATVLWALTAKPPLALTAGAVLLGLRQWRPVLLAVVFTGVAAAALQPLMGPGWVDDYLQMLRTYNLVESDPAYAFAFAPHHMANLRGLLNTDFHVADDVASRVSLLVWMAALGVVAVAGRRLRLGRGGLWSLGVLLYLLFCPHVSSMEVLQVCLLVPFCIPPKRGHVELSEWLLFIAAPLLPLLSPAFIGNRAILFSALVLSMGLVAASQRRRARDVVGAVPLGVSSRG